MPITLNSGSLNFKNPNDGTYAESDILTRPIEIQARTQVVTIPSGSKSSGIVNLLVPSGWQFIAAVGSGGMNNFTEPTYIYDSSHSAITVWTTNNVASDVQILVTYIIYR